MTDLIYCPICGHTLGWREEGGRPRQACDNCGYVHYVNPVPAVGILIEMDGGVVLIRRGQPPHQGEWTLPSGFIEADESAEDAAIREAEEETGLKVEIIEMAGINSFPEGPPTSGIIIFYRAKPVGGTLQGGDDAAEARVFQPGEIPRMPFRTHREVMAEWLAQNNPQTPASETPYRVLMGHEDGKLGDPDEYYQEGQQEQEFVIRSAEARDDDEIMALLALIPANRQLSNDEWQEITLRFRESAGFEVFVAAESDSDRVHCPIHFADADGWTRVHP
jgi:8-oxo-dGTP diphosphatase